jgi:DNA-binding XRE family transcriptional regulator
MDAKEFATWRQQVGITQEELANRWARVTRTTIQNWESGATPIPEAAATACQIWERRLKQENPNLGPVTLIYADGPMFVDAYRPGRLSMLKQEPYATNASALARVLQLWERDDFCNPFIIEKSGADLWNVAELRRVAIREDSNSPTLVNLLKRLAKNIKVTSTTYARMGPKMLNASEAKDQQRRIEALAKQLDGLAADAIEGPISYQRVEDVLSKLRNLGKHVPNQVISNIVDAFGSTV